MRGTATSASQNISTNFSHTLTSTFCWLREKELGAAAGGAKFSSRALSFSLDRLLYEEGEQEDAARGWIVHVRISGSSTSDQALTAFFTDFRS